MDNSDRKYSTLIKSVFSTEDGLALLKLLIHRKMSGKMFIKDPIEQAYKIGQVDLIQELRAEIKADLDERADAIKVVKYNPFDRS